MPLSVQTNLLSLSTQMYLGRSQALLSRSYQRLSSGYRINSAADDAAGLAMASTMNAQVRSYAAAERSTLNAISLTETAESGLASQTSLLSRMRELAVQASNGDLTTTDRALIQTEYASLTSELDRVASSTVFNSHSLLSANATSVAFQVGIQGNAADRISVTFAETTTNTLSLSAGNASVGGAATNASAAIASIDAALVTVAGRRASLGAAINRFEIATSNIQSMRVNLTAASSRIMDADYAEETSLLTRNQLISQMGTALLAQANQFPAMALQLLR